MTKHLKITITVSTLLIVSGVGFYILTNKPAVQTTTPAPTVIPSIQPVVEAPILPPPPVPEQSQPSNSTYYAITLKSSTPSKELADYVGPSNIESVLKLNRIDAKFLKTGSVVVIPRDLDYMKLSPFPLHLAIADMVPKLLMVSQRVQAFGVYENGQLVRWGPVSTGKKSTPTPSRLYFTNWKGKEVKSSFDDEWVLKWNFNLDNHEGIGMHQYEMPGYPASHSCMRMFADDAEWMYNWADQWELSNNEQTIVANGTPVIIFGDYAYGMTAPWKNLPNDDLATTVTTTELEAVLQPSLTEIEQVIQ